MGSLRKNSDLKVSWVAIANNNRLVGLILSEPIFASSEIANLTKMIGVAN